MVRASNADRMKQQNRQLILRLLRTEMLSRAELSRRTGLTRAAVSIITDPLISAGIIQEAGTGVAASGRKPVLLKLNASARYAVGINLYRGGVKAGVCDLCGSVAAVCAIGIDQAETAEEALAIICAEVGRLMKKEHLSGNRLLGIGVTAPGPLADGVILEPPNFAIWKNVPIAKYLHEAFSCRVLLENKSSALAQAEKSYGAGTKCSSFIELLVDSGVGSGVVSGGELFRTGSGFGSEIGHTTIRPEGKRCECGNIGCLECYASSTAIAAAYGKKNWQEIANGAEAGAEDCLMAVEQEAQYLADGLVNAVNILGSEAVILAGEIAYRPELLMARLKQLINSRSITRAYQHVAVLPSQIEDGAGILTAANLILDDFFEGSI